MKVFKLLCIITLALLSGTGFAQVTPDTVVINFTDYQILNSKSYGFCKLVNLQNDSFYYYGEPYKIIYPDNFRYSDTAITDIYFTGWSDPAISRSTSVLVGNFQSSRPVLYIDRNRNLDFSDDGSPTIMDADSGSLIYLQNEQNPNALFPVRLFRKSLSEDSKAGTEEMLKQMGPLARKNKFVPINYWFADQRSNYRITHTIIDGMPVFIGIKDYNCNGLYNDLEKDVIMVGDHENNTISDRPQGGALNYSDSAVIKINNKTYRVVEISETGDKLTIVRTNLYFNEILKSGDSLPSITVDLIGDSSVDIAQLTEEGMYLLIDVWGMWCKPCLHNIPKLEKIYFDNQDKLQVISLNYGDKRENVEDFFKKTPPGWPLNGYVTKEFMEVFNVDVFPDYILVDPSGHILNMNIGLSELEKLLKEQN